MAQMRPVARNITLERKERMMEGKKGLIINVYQERSSMRGIERTFGVSRRTLSAWLKEQANDLPPLEETLQPVECKKIPVLEVDELRSFVFRRKDKVWVWIAMNRETREIVASACGARFLRKTLSFSKCVKMHEICLKLFIHRYNTELLPIVG